MTSDWLIDLHSANFSNSLKQKITKLEPMNLPRFPSFYLPNSCIKKIPSCTCCGFRRDCLPCKHFFVVTDAGYGTFEQLSPLLLEHPLVTLDENLFNSKLTKPDLSPNLLYNEIHELQVNVNLLDEFPEVEVTDKTEYAPLE